MARRARRAKGRGSRKPGKRSVKDLQPGRGGDPRGGAAAAARKLTFGAPGPADDAERGA
jgi:hypothetical protein